MDIVRGQKSGKEVFLSSRLTVLLENHLQLHLWALATATRPPVCHLKLHGLAPGCCRQILLRGDVSGSIARHCKALQGIQLDLITGGYH